MSQASLSLMILSLVLGLVSGGGSSLHAQEAGAQRAALERAYSAWRTAMISKDGGAWERATAASRKATTKNLMISQRHAFPKALFEVPIRPPSILQLRLLDEHVLGSRAQLAYIGKVDMGVGFEGEIPENLLILRFIREGERWLFDTLKFASLTGQEEERARLTAGDVTLLREGFALPTEDPVVNKIVSYPDYVGHLQVTVSGFRATLRVNGHDCGVVENSNVTNVVIGGLNKGRNELIVDVVKLPMEDEEKRYFSINGYVVTGKDDNPRARVFRYLPEDPHAVPNRIKTEIWANAVTMERR